MEVTATFNELLKARSAPLVGGRLRTVDKIDDYLKEAFSINDDIVKLHNELSHIRQAYLRAAAPRKTRIYKARPQKDAVYLSDADRNVVDKMAKEALQRLDLRIRILLDEEHHRHLAVAKSIQEKHGRGLRALQSWAAGGRLGEAGVRSPEHEWAVEQEGQIHEHRELVMAYLRQKLAAVVQLQRGMMETRLAREIEKNRSVLAKAQSSQLPAALAKEFGFDDAASAWKAPASATALDEEQESRRRQADADLGLTDEQIQTFERDNQDMLKHYSSAIDKVRTVEKSLLDIAELQQMLADNLTVQSAHIDQLVADSDRTEENVGGGNKELKKASEKTFSQARMTFYAATALCTFLVLWDFII